MPLESKPAVAPPPRTSQLLTVLFETSALHLIKIRQARAGNNQSHMSSHDIKPQRHMPKRSITTVKAFACIVLAIFVGSWSEALAQSAGTIRGTVTDPSAAVVPNATVTATGNNVNRTAKTDGQGHYTLANVPPGNYNIRADAPGFVTLRAPGSMSRPARPAPLNIALQIATESQQIQVNDQATTALSTDASSKRQRPRPEGRRSRSTARRPR